MKNDLFSEIIKKKGNFIIESLLHINSIYLRSQPQFDSM